MPIISTNVECFESGYSLKVIWVLCAVLFVVQKLAAGEPESNMHLSTGVMSPVSVETIIVKKRQDSLFDKGKFGSPIPLSCSSTRNFYRIFTHVA